MSFNLDVINILVVLVALINTVYGLIVYSRNRKNHTNLSFFLLTLAVSAWGFSMFAYRGFNNLDTVILFSRILYVSAAAIPTAFLYFVFIFPRENGIFTEWQKYLLPIPFALVAVSSLVPDWLIQSVDIVPLGERIIIFNQQLHLWYGLYIVGYFGAGYFIILKRLVGATGVYRLQLLYIISGTLVATLIGITTNLILPLLGVFALNWFGQVGVVVMIAAISYAILKHHLFNVRVIATEISVAALWVFIFIRTFLSDDPQEKITNTGLLALTIIVGIFLIRSIQKDIEREISEKEKEIQHRKEVEKLAEDLETANKGQEGLIHTISHEVKGGLARAGGVFASIIEGDYDSDARGMKEELAEALRLNRRDVADLEQTLLAFNPRLGTEAYNIEIFDFRAALMETLKNLKTGAEAKNLALETRADEKESYIITGDRAKIVSRVLHNLIENAILYTPTGRITASLSKKDGKILLSVTDTGIGIAPEDMRVLFTRGGHGQESIKVNVHSTGNGLYLAKTVVEKHGGKIWAESHGAGKGATFFVELPSIT